MYNGLPCATTTRYWDGQEGACGCGSGSAFAWQGQYYTAAASQAIYDEGGSSWCGAGCGSCWQLTPTGDCPTGGPCASQTNPITVMVTNLCPYNGNQQWCPNPGNANQYGYRQHFDLLDLNMDGLISQLGWNNPVVTYKRVPCGGEGSPSCSLAGQCTPCSGTLTTCDAVTAATTIAAAASSGSSSNSGSSGGGGSSSSGTCSATVSYSVNSWSGAGQISLSIQNTGSKTVTGVQLSITGTVTNFWNLSSQGNGLYTLINTSIGPGQTSTSAGFQYSGSTAAKATLVSGSVKC